MTGFKNTGKIGNIVSWDIFMEDRTYEALSRMQTRDFGAGHDLSALRGAAPSKRKVEWMGVRI